ncbi:aminoacyl-histidine dipeptidase [Robiginitalea aurantiaca]|uniref:Aminoacyl-histidine dipeptidase n=1 Tax=Robiginitalea aurantiaca TaxID=3056915 RepID=A0ABT7WGK1_9FLAO|nr:aminoacyl-histidine dipeptidase [Robiginitalea aurantiaca]MDM9632047.1 aminoacyl-histidine dipeptidase [Robiginitalea aurantiaca]
MSAAIASIEPIPVWKHFANLNAVPRPSKEEERVIAFMVEFGNSLGLDTQTDPSGNVLIRKPATPGMEGRKTVVLQAHLDMVHQKNGATQFDFSTQGIQMYVDGDWVRAAGTTLGADNGLGVAAIMGILASETIPHPAIEALFTIDEETGMTGAKNLDADFLTGSILLNLDTEEDDTLCVGCAGGVDVTATGTYDQVTPGDGYRGLVLSIKGLKGGHSGMDIHKGLGNANLIISRLILSGLEAAPLRLASMEGGSLRNAIPREATAGIVFSSAVEKAVLQALESEKSAILQEYEVKEDALQIGIESVETPEKVMQSEDTVRLLNCLYSLQNGVYAMSSEFPDLVETSNNVARVNVGGGKIEIACLTRSSRESAKSDLVRKLRASFEPAGYLVTTSGDYPGWLPDITSPVLKVVSRRYASLFGEDPKVLAGHGGLECGILKNHYPGIDMISFGPTILGAHSPDERASVSSTLKFWKLLQDVLAHIPEAD